MKVKRTENCPVCGQKIEFTEDREDEKLLYKHYSCPTGHYSIEWNHGKITVNYKNVVVMYGSKLDIEDVVAINKAESILMTREIEKWNQRKSRAKSLESPALVEQSKSYPASWKGRVPSRIRMDKTVVSDMPFLENLLCAYENNQYDAYVNSHGALCAIFQDCDMLGLKPYEFTVIEWHKSKGKK